MQKITVLFFIISITGFSQSISKQVIGPGGQTYENGNNKLSYTLGEVAVGAMTDEDGTNLPLRKCPGAVLAVQSS
jgi:hypothetical protein